MSSVRKARQKLNRWERYYQRYDHLFVDGRHPSGWARERALQQYGMAVGHALRKEMKTVRPELIELLDDYLKNGVMRYGQYRADSQGEGVRGSTCTCAACRTNKDRADS